MGNKNDGKACGYVLNVMVTEIEREIDAMSAPIYLDTHLDRLPIAHSPPDADSLSTSLSTSWRAPLLHKPNLVEGAVANGLATGVDITSAENIVHQIIHTRRPPGGALPRLFVRNPLPCLCVKVKSIST